MNAWLECNARFKPIGDSPFDSGAWVSAFDRRVEAEALRNEPERSRIVLLSLARNAEEHKEKQGAERVQPTRQLDRDEEGVVAPPDERGYQPDVGEVEVHVGPGYVRGQIDALVADVDAVNAERNSADHFDTCEEHETEVSAGVERLVG